MHVMKLWSSRNPPNYSDLNYLLPAVLAANLFAKLYCIHNGTVAINYYAL